MLVMLNIWVFILCWPNIYFKLSMHESCSRFYKALNGIYSKRKGNMNKMVTFQLINADCKPLLIYACECVKLIEVIYYNWIGLGILYSGKYLKLMTRIALLIFILVLGNYQFLWISIQEK